MGVVNVLTVVGNTITKCSRSVGDTKCESNSRGSQSSVPLTSLDAQSSELDDDDDDDDDHDHDHDDDDDEAVWASKLTKSVGSVKAN